MIESDPLATVLYIKNNIYKASQTTKYQSNHKAEALKIDLNKFQALHFKIRYSDLI